MLNPLDQLLADLAAADDPLVAEFARDLLRDGEAAPGDSRVSAAEPVVVEK